MHVQYVSGMANAKTNTTVIPAKLTVNVLSSLSDSSDAAGTSTTCEAGQRHSQSTIMKQNTLDWLEPVQHV